MKITFQNQDISKTYDQNRTKERDTAYKADINSPVSVRLDLGNKPQKGTDNLFPGNEKTKSGKTLTEIMQEAGAVDASVNQDYRTVLSNTMSAEDYARAEKEGFDYYSMDPDEVVTIQDRIKAEVAKSGEVIVGYNDNLSGETLAKAVGSETLARSLEKGFTQADLPMSDENISDITKAWELASALTEPDNAQLAYLFENDLDTDIWGLYLSQNSGNISGKELSEEPVRLDEKGNEKLLKQVTDILEKAGYTEKEDIEEGLDSAQWLLDRELPVNVDNIKKIKKAATVEFPITEENFTRSVVKAVSEGKKPTEADLSNEGRTNRYITDGYDPKESIVQQAVSLERFWFSDESLSVITDRRRIEEVRLSMTAEVNIKLLSSGFEIDTAPIEDFIEELKKAEIDVASRYFPDREEDRSVGSYRLMNEVNESVEEIRLVPAANLGMYASRSAEDITVGEFRDTGIRLKDTYEKAGETYEALMTAPRSDLGDNIKKAFANISSLADEIGIEKSDENLRAIRILGYNHMEVSTENVARIAAADSMVRGIIERMTPASVLNMIRDGINPLETSFAELSTYFDTQQTGGYESAAKSYSEFLYGLEMQENITPEERESYIGIYRLIHQVEKADGAAIGTVLNQQAQLSFENLLSAARTRRLSRVDVRIDEGFGGTTDLIRTGISITEQIATAYDAERNAQLAEELRNAANVSRAAAQTLAEKDISMTADNLLTMDTLIENESNLYEEITKYEKGKEKVKEASEKMKEALSSEDFDRVYEEETEKLEGFTQELTMSADSYIDVRAMSLVNKQLRLSARISRSTDALEDRDYIIPMEFGDEISKVHISFKRAHGNARVNISTRIDDEDVEGFFEISKGVLEGYIAQNSESTLKKMQTAADILTETLKEYFASSDIATGNIPVINKDKFAGKANLYENDNSQGKDAKAADSDGSERRILLQVTRLFLQAVGDAQ